MSVAGHGWLTLLHKELLRFWKVSFQTIAAPILTSLLYLLIFSHALESRVQVYPGVAYKAFLVPGLAMMSLLQNAFANSSFSLLVGKVQGTIVDYLMPPLSTGELMLGMIGASVTRAFLVGLAVFVAMQFWPGVHVWPLHFWALLWFGLMGSMMLALLGLITSVWAEKFDHAAAVGNFVVAPLSLLSGTFYSVDALSPTFAAISHANPFFYVISGFRYGFLGGADSPILFGALLLLAINVVLGLICYSILSAGWKIKA